MNRHGVRGETTSSGAPVGARAAGLLAVVGFACGVLVVLVGGRIDSVPLAIPLTNWVGVLSTSGVPPGNAVPGALMLAGIAGLVGLWVVANVVFRSAVHAERQVWWIAGAWSLPFVVGPPMLSNDVWTYAAQGLMVRDGLDPYSSGPSALGNIPVVEAVDPYWRSVPSPYGPLATTVQHLAVAISGGNPIGAVIVFRGLGVACLIAIGVLAADIAGRRRVQALVLTVLNPLLLLHVVSGAHLDGVMCALLLGALACAQRERWVLAVVLACAAGSVKAPAFIAVLAVIAVHAHHARGGRAWRVAAGYAAVAVISVAGFTVVVSHGSGWVRALNTPSLGHTVLAPASLVADLLHPIVSGASSDDLATGGRVSMLLAALCVVVYLTATANWRSLADTVGYGLLAVALLSPVVYPWYLLWAVVCFAPTPTDSHRDWVLALSASASLFDPPGFSRPTSIRLSILAVAVCVALLAPRALRRHRELPPPPVATPWGH
ncbi:MAG: hypothetical protein JWP07_2258 [Pseudonocardiales bacterium]|nr:hypothetical protein [Pseudonocardiales bacterium]